MSKVHKLKVSSRYYDDHVECGGDWDGWCKTIIKYSKDGRYVYVELNDDQLSDLESRADYYSMSFGLDPEYMGLSYSAQAVVRQIKKYRQSIEVAA